MSSLWGQEGTVIMIPFSFMNISFSICLRMLVNLLVQKSKPNKWESPALLNLKITYLLISLLSRLILELSSKVNSYSIIGFITSSPSPFTSSFSKLSFSFFGIAKYLFLAISIIALNLKTRLL